MAKRTAQSLRNEAAAWRFGAEITANTTEHLFRVTTTGAMRRRHAMHYSSIEERLTPLSRSLFCLFMACECLDEARDGEADAE